MTFAKVHSHHCQIVGNIAARHREACGVKSLICWEKLDNANTISSIHRKYKKWIGFLL